MKTHLGKARHPKELITIRLAIFMSLFTRPKRKIMKVSFCLISSWLKAANLHWFSLLTVACVPHMALFVPRTIWVTEHLDEYRIIKKNFAFTKMSISAFFGITTLPCSHFIWSKPQLLLDTNKTNLIPSLIRNPQPGSVPWAFCFFCKKYWN